MPPSNISHRRLWRCDLRSLLERGWNVQGWSRCVEAQPVVGVLVASVRRSPELPRNMGGYILYNLRNNNFRPFWKDRCPNSTVVIKAVQNVVVKLMTLRRVFMKCNNVGKSPESSPVGSRSRGDASGCSVGSRLKRKVGYERSPHYVYKACDCNFIWPVQNVFRCVCARADIGEGRLFSEMHGPECNPSSHSMIIKTIVLCGDRNRS